jgi:hypothetical protein
MLEIFKRVFNSAAKFRPWLSDLKIFSSSFEKHVIFHICNMLACY